MRLFIGIPAAGSLKQEALKTLQELKQTGADYKWVEPDNLHWSLQFLGETSEEKVASIETALEKAALDLKAFDLTLDRLGAFPSPDDPRTLWLSPQKGAVELKGLGDRLCEGLSLLGFVRQQREFKPHLTLGRQRSPRYLERIKKMLKRHPLFPDQAGMKATQIHLYQSRLTPQGPLYTTLIAVALEGTCPQ